MEQPSDFLPTATLETLRLRARMLAAVRRFFDARGYWEVETPLLSHDGAIDPHLQPFVTAGPNGTPLYLQTSPEFGMKRLLAAGAEAIYQVGRVFRRGESGRRHNPEFTMVEWYRVGDTHHEQMQVVEELVIAVMRQESVVSGQWSVAAGRSPAFLQSRASETPFLRTRYQDAFVRCVGVDVFKLGTRELAELARERLATVPESLAADDRDGWLNLLLAELVEPRLGIDRPEFLYDYPATQSALAKIRPDNPPVAERFELYIQGIELCNGYHELTDAAELRQRISDESQRRTAEGLPELPASNRLLAAMDHGLPACSGVALGFDRLVMLAAGVDSIAEVIAFPIDSA